MAIKMNPQVNINHFIWFLVKLHVNLNFVYFTSCCSFRAHLFIHDPRHFHDLDLRELIILSKWLEKHVEDPDIKLSYLR